MSKDELLSQALSLQSARRVERELSTEFARKFRQWRRWSEVQQQDVAKRCGVSAAYLHDMEKSQRNISDRLLERIIEMLRDEVAALQR